MKRFIAVAAILALFTFTTLADDLAKLEGKWSLKKTNAEGQSITQTMEIKTNTFKFKIIRGDQTAIYAEGQLKLEKSGPFNVVKFSDIKAGSSESDLDEINDDHISIYVLDGDAWTLAANFDKERDDQKPSLDRYTKAAN
jgi:hypothetical protein